MPWSYVIDVERDVMLISASGLLTDEELLFGLARAAKDRDFHPGIRILADYGGVTTVKLSAETLLTVAAYPFFSVETRRAFLITSDIFGGFLNFVKAHAVGKFEVFRDRPSAVAWLNEGVPAEKMLV